MSVRELKRIEVFARVKARTLKVKDAAVLLGVSERQAKRLWRRYPGAGPMALRHKSAGRKSNRAKPTAWRRKVVALCRRKYAGDAERAYAPFGPTLAAEHMRDDGGVAVDPETLRRRSVILTSNLVFGDWDRIFRDQMATAAAIDRLVHHSGLLEFDVLSFRAEEAEGRKKKKTGPSASA